MISDTWCYIGSTSPRCNRHHQDPETSFLPGDPNLNLHLPRWHESGIDPNHSFHTHKQTVKEAILLHQLQHNHASNFGEKIGSSQKHAETSQPPRSPCPSYDSPAKCFNTFNTIQSAYSKKNSGTWTLENLHQNTFLLGWKKKETFQTSRNAKALTPSISWARSFNVKVLFLPATWDVNDLFLARANSSGKTLPWWW